MKVNIPINSADVVVLVIVGLLMLYGIKLVIGFFHEGKHKVVNSSYNGRGTVKMTLAVDGMMCGQCEAHVSDAIRKKFDIEKVSSNHTKGETIIISKHDIADADLSDAISETGYILKGVTRENYAKRAFGFGH